MVPVRFKAVEQCVVILMMTMTILTRSPFPIHYVPSSPMYLLSPQHWNQVMQDHVPDEEGTWCATYSRSVALYWNQRKFKRTIPINNRTNIPVSMSSAGATNARCSLAIIDKAINISFLERTFLYCSMKTPLLPSADRHHVINKNKNTKISC